MTYAAFDVEGGSDDPYRTVQILKWDSSDRYVCDVVHCANNCSHMKEALSTLRDVNEIFVFDSQLECKTLVNSGHSEFCKKITDLKNKECIGLQTFAQRLGISTPGKNAQQGKCWKYHTKLDVYNSYACNDVFVLAISQGLPVRDIFEYSASYCSCSPSTNQAPVVLLEGKDEWESWLLQGPLMITKKEKARWRSSVPISTHSVVEISKLIHAGNWDGLSLQTSWDKGVFTVGIGSRTVEFICNRRPTLSTLHQILQMPNDNVQQIACKEDVDEPLSSLWNAVEIGHRPYIEGNYMRCGALKFHKRLFGLGAKRNKNKSNSGSSKANAKIWLNNWDKFSAGELYPFCPLTRQLPVEYKDNITTHRYVLDTNDGWCYHLAKYAVRQEYDCKIDKADKYVCSENVYEDLTRYSLRCSGEDQNGKVLFSLQPINQEGHVVLAIDSYTPLDFETLKCDVFEYLCEYDQDLRILDTVDINRGFIQPQPLHNARRVLDFQPISKEAIDPSTNTRVCLDYCSKKAPEDKEVDSVKKPAKERNSKRLTAEVLNPCSSKLHDIRYPTAHRPKDFLQPFNRLLIRKNSYEEFFSDSEESFEEPPTPKKNVFSRKLRELKNQGHKYIENLQVGKNIHNLKETVKNILPHKFSIKPPLADVRLPFTGTKDEPQLSPPKPFTYETPIGLLEESSGKVVFKPRYKDMEIIKNLESILYGSHEWEVISKNYLKDIDSLHSHHTLQESLEFVIATALRVQTQACENYFCYHLNHSVVSPTFKQSLMKLNVISGCLYPDVKIVQQGDHARRVTDFEIHGRFAWKGTRPYPLISQHALKNPIVQTASKDGLEIVHTENRGHSGHPGLRLCSDAMNLISWQSAKQFCASHTLIDHGCKIFVVRKFIQRFLSDVDHFNIVLCRPNVLPNDREYWDRLSTINIHPGTEEIYRNGSILYTDMTFEDTLEYYANQRIVHIVHDTHYYLTNQFLPPNHIGYISGMKFRGRFGNNDMDGLHMNVRADKNYTLDIFPRESQAWVRFKPNGQDEGYEHLLQNPKVNQLRSIQIDDNIIFFSGSISGVLDFNRFYMSGKIFMKSSISYVLKNTVNVDNLVPILSGITPDAKTICENKDSILEQLEYDEFLTEIGNDSHFTLRNRLKGIQNVEFLERLTGEYLDFLDIPLRSASEFLGILFFFRKKWLFQYDSFGFVGGYKATKFLVHLLTLVFFMRFYPIFYLANMYVMQPIDKYLMLVSLFMTTLLCLVGYSHYVCLTVVFVSLFSRVSIKKLMISSATSVVLFHSLLSHVLEFWEKIFLHVLGITLYLQPWNMLGGYTYESKRFLPSDFSWNKNLTRVRWLWGCLRQAFNLAERFDFFVGKKDPNVSQYGPKVFIGDEEPNVFEHKNDQRSYFAAILKRQLATQLLPDPTMVSEFKRFCAPIIEEIIAAMNDFEPINIIKEVRNSPGWSKSKKDKYIRNSFLMLSDDVSCYKKCFYDAMVKVGEKYVKRLSTLVEEVSSRARLIFVPMGVAFTGLLTVLQRPIFKKIRVFIVGFCHGDNSSRLKERLIHGISLIEDAVCICLDGSNHDGHQHWDLIKCVDIPFWDAYYKSSIMDQCLAYYDYDKNKIINLCKKSTHECEAELRIHSKLGRLCTMKIKGTTFSGSATRTTLGNTLRVLLYFHFYLTKMGIPNNLFKRNAHSFVMVSGDDVCLWLDRRYLSTFKEQFYNFVSRDKSSKVHGLGQCIQSYQVGKWWSFDFCSKNSILVDDEWIISRDQHKMLLTSSYYTNAGLNGLSKEQWLSAMADMFRHECWGPLRHILANTYSKTDTDGDRLRLHPYGIDCAHYGSTLVESSSFIGWCKAARLSLSEGLRLCISLVDHNILHLPCDYLDRELYIESPDDNISNHPICGSDCIYCQTYGSAPTFVNNTHMYSENKVKRNKKFFKNQNLQKSNQNNQQPEKNENSRDTPMLGITKKGAKNLSDNRKQGSDGNSSKKTTNKKSHMAARMGSGRHPTTQQLRKGAELYSRSESEEIRFLLARHEPGIESKYMLDHIVYPAPTGVVESSITVTEDFSPTPNTLNLDYTVIMSLPTLTVLNAGTEAAPARKSGLYMYAGGSESSGITMAGVWTNSKPCVDVWGTDFGTVGSKGFIWASKHKITVNAPEATLSGVAYTGQFPVHALHKGSFSVENLMTLASRTHKLDNPFTLVNSVNQTNLVTKDDDEVSTSTTWERSLSGELISYAVLVKPAVNISGTGNVPISLTIENTGNFVWWPKNDKQSISVAESHFSSSTRLPKEEAFEDLPWEIDESYQNRNTSTLVRIARQIARSLPHVRPLVQPDRDLVCSEEEASAWGINEWKYAVNNLGDVTVPGVFAINDYDRKNKTDAYEVYTQLQEYLEILQDLRTLCEKHL
jgi:hypothetical protein